MKFEFEVVSIYATGSGAVATIKCGQRVEAIIVGSAFVNNVKTGDKIIIEIKKP